MVNILNYAGCNNDLIPDNTRLGPKRTIPLYFITLIQIMLMIFYTMAQLRV